MPFKFVNWFFAQKKHDTKIGELAKRCVHDDDFPIRAKHFQDVLDYFESSGFGKEDIETVLEAWNDFRKLGKVEVIPINQLRAKYYDPLFG